MLLLLKGGGGVRFSGSWGLKETLDGMICPGFIMKGMGPMTDIEFKFGGMPWSELNLMGGRIPKGITIGLDRMRPSSSSALVSSSSVEQMMEIRSPVTKGISGTAVAFLLVMGKTLTKSSWPSIGRLSTTHLLLSSGFLFINI